MRKFLYIFIFLTMFFMFNSNVDAATISDGIYTIESAISSKVIDVANGTAKSGTNVQLYTSNSTNAQKWKVTNLGDGYYEIASLVDESLVLDVDGAGTKSGTNVQIYKSNSTNAQKWTLKYAGDGYYYIISKCNGLYLDVSGAKSANGTNIQVYKGNSTKAQKFKFIEVLEGTQTIEDGLYKITTSLDEGKAINVIDANASNSTKTEIRDITDDWSNIWRVKYLGDGYYEIISYLDETKSLDVSGGSGANETKVQIYKSNSTNAQKWIIKDVGDGYYSIVSAIDHKYLDVANGSSSNGTKMQIYQGNSTKAQKFKFVSVEEEIITDGYYTLNSALDNSKVVSSSSILTANQVNVDLETNKNLNKQKWYIEYLEDGYYTLKLATNDNYVMDVAGGSTSSGTNVQIYSSNNTDAQKWYIKDAGDGYYYLIAKNGGMYLDVAGGSSADGTNIQVYKGNSTNAQKFKLTSTEISAEEEITQNYDEAYYTISSKLSSSKVLDVDNGEKANGTNVQLYQSNSTVAQIWYLNKLEDGYYYITSSMNPETALTADGDNVELSKYTGSDYQKWVIQDIGDGYVYIISKATGLYVNVAGSSTSNKTNIELATGNNADSQMFKLNTYTDEKVYTGIDVSHHQSLIDWATVANSDIGFVIIRAGYGGDWTSQDDKQFLNNVAACEEYNIPYGLYLYSYASEIDDSDTSAQAEAKHMLRLIDEIEEYGYSPTLGTKVFIDMEDNSVVSAGKTKLTAVSDTFCSIIEENGYTCGIYANKNWLTNYLNATELANKYEIWLAEWLSVTSPTFSYAKTQKPTYNLTSYKYWQFASDGSISGITGNVDMDLGYDIFD